MYLYNGTAFNSTPLHCAGRRETAAHPAGRTHRPVRPRHTREYAWAHSRAEARKQMMVFMVMHDLKEHRFWFLHLTFDKVCCDPLVPVAYGATITYDVPLVKPPQPALETAQQLMVRLAQTIALFCLCGWFFLLFCVVLFGLFC